MVTINDAIENAQTSAVPLDWEIKELKQASVIIDSLHQTPSFSDQGFAMVRVTDIKPGNLNLEDAARVDEKTYLEFIRNYKPVRGDIVLSRVGSYGVSSFVGTDEPFCMGQNTVVIHPLINNRLLYYMLNSKFVRQQIDKESFGTGYKSLSLKNVKELRLPIPTLNEEQSKIAQTLLDIDSFVDSLDRLIEKKKNIKQGAMQELLTGKKRLTKLSNLANNSSQYYQLTDFGKVPRDWQIVKLKEIIDPNRSIRYGIVQPGDFDPNGRYMIRGQDYSQSKGWAKPSEVFRVSAKVENKYKNARVRNGDVIMTIVGAYCGHIDVIPSWLDGANITQTTARIAIDSTRANSQFCKYQLQSGFGKLQVAMFLKGGAQPGLNICDIQNFVIALPSLLEQSIIAEILTGLDQELISLEEKRDKYKLLKVGLMQQLLTGRIRLKCQS